MTEDNEKPDTLHNELAASEVGRTFNTMLLYTDPNTEEGDEPAGVTIRGDLDAVAVGLYRLIDALGNQAVEVGAVAPEDAEKHSTATLGMLIMERSLSQLCDSSNEGESVH